MVSFKANLVLSFTPLSAHPVGRFDPDVNLRRSQQLGRALPRRVAAAEVWLQHRGSGVLDAGLVQRKPTARGWLLSPGEAGAGRSLSEALPWVGAWSGAAGLRSGSTRWDEACFPVRSPSSSPVSHRLSATAV